MASYKSSYRESSDQQIVFPPEIEALKGQCLPARLSKELLLANHGQNLRQLNDQSAPSLAKKFTLPQAYPPSLVPLKSLQKILLRDMLLETHHKNRFLVAKLIGAPYMHAGTTTILEDEAGDVEKVSVHNFGDSPDDPILLQGIVIAIKEPYYQLSADGTHEIRVDHPSDIYIAKVDDSSIHSEFQTDFHKEKTADEWRNEGDKAFLEKKYHSTLSCYNRALQTASPENTAFIQNLYRKRASINIILHRFDAAKADSYAGMSERYLGRNALLLALKATYELGDYELSKTLLESGLRDFPNNPGISAYSQRIIDRVKEQKHGRYDFDSMLRSVQDGNIHLDHASYFCDTAIGKTNRHGRGLFASRSFNFGELVLCEKAFCLPSQQSRDELFNQSGAVLFSKLVNKLQHNQSLHERFFDLDSGDYPRSKLPSSQDTGEKLRVVDDMPIVDVFLVETIREKNCFNAPLRSSEVATNNTPTINDALAAGLWCRAAYINHSCLPNTLRTFIGDMQILRATRTIPAGAEITFQYLAPDTDLATRQDHFKRSWGFKCDCVLCSSEGKSSEAMREKRTTLFHTIRAVVMKNASPYRVSKTFIRKVQGLTSRLEGMYEPSLYDELPRLALIHPTLWLTEAWRSHQNHDKVLVYAFELLRNFGLFTTVVDGKLEIHRSVAMMNIEMVRAFKYAYEAYTAIGELGLARQCLQEGELEYLITTGYSEGAQKFFDIA
ncbi:hypothetical protein AOQ84DRAFT_425738 [Glonium stellatum]|uniref:SET domain-containing protein n=1 Tax=Glonium stellatum TaxID=574774 RepID=A0A8E2F699_9PEZI|nr:hypothetical protein AOQ84DRAFT_425738 [Glonium stellatum]